MNNNEAFFSVRDDDINYFTDVDELVAFYQPLLLWLRPTLCLTPFAGEIYKRIRERENELIGRPRKLNYVNKLIENDSEIINITYSIFDNKKLMVQLKKWVTEGLVEIALHGITHNQTTKGFECEVDPPDINFFRDVKEKLEHYLECKISVFSPPNNSISRGWLSLLSKSSMNIVCSVGLKPHEMPFNKKSLNSLVQILFNRFFEGKSSRVRTVLDYDEFKLIPSYTVEPYQELNVHEAFLEKYKRKNECFILAIHSYAISYDPLMAGRLKNFFLHARKLGFSAVTIGECFVC